MCTLWRYVAGAMSILLFVLALDSCWTPQTGTPVSPSATLALRVPPQTDGISRQPPKATSLTSHRKPTADKKPTRPVSIAATAMPTATETPAAIPLPTLTTPMTIVPVPSTATSPMPAKERETVRITVVFDNSPLDPRLRTGWGFAAWVEYGDKVVLFDTGAQGAVLLSNMAALGLDPQAIDIVVLSHDHGDHIGGLAAILSANPRVVVYVPQAFPATFKRQVHSSGAKVVGVDGPLEILPGLWTTGQMGSNPVEQALVVRARQGLVVMAGCAHPGVDRMVARAKGIGRDEINLVVGGFHLGGASQKRVRGIVDEFRVMGVEQVAPSHCTGGAARHIFRSEYGKDYHAVGVGWQWDSEVTGWEPAGQGIPAQVGVVTVAIAPSDTDVVYLAAYESSGLYRSTDGGRTWQARGAGLGGLAPLSVAVHPEDPGVAWVGTMAGGFRTDDGGQRWEPMLDLPQMPFYALAVALDGSLLHAGGEAVGAWRSDDGGQTWLAGELADGQTTVLSLALTADGAAFAGTAGRGVWTSDDGGKDWRATGWEQAPANVTSLCATGGGRLYALGEGRLYLSQDGGDSWEMVGSPGLQALSFAVQSDPVGRLYFGGKGGILQVSSDGGRSWLSVADQFRHADITSLVTSPDGEGLAYLGTRHNGLYLTVDGGKRWRLVSGEVGRRLITALAQDPVDPGTFYAGTLDGVYRSVDDGATWQLSSAAVGKIFVQGLALTRSSERIFAGARTGVYLSEDRGRTWRWLEEEIGPISVFNVAIDPHDEDRVYAGSWGHNILRSRDGGRSWTPIHNGLETLSVHAIALDPDDPQVLHVGTVEAIYRSDDGGQSWQAHSLADRVLSTFALVVDPADPRLLYAGTTEGVYRSIDKGQIWEACGADSLGATVTALALDPSDSQTMYAGTEHHGLFRSEDGGSHWQPWGLDGTSVYDILADRSGRVWLATDRGIFRQAEKSATP